MTMLLFIRTAIFVDNKLATDFIILGLIPSNHIALLESNAIIKVDTCSRVIIGILIIYRLALYNSRSVISVSRLSLSLLPKISEMKENIHSFQLQYLMKIYTVHCL